MRTASFGVALALFLIAFADLSGAEPPQESLPAIGDLPRQYYSEWYRDPLAGHFYRIYYFRPDADSPKYAHQLCVHFPDREGLFYFNVEKRVFWGRARKGQYGVLDQDGRTGDIAAIREEDFAPDVAFDQVPMPQRPAGDATTMLPPPESAPDAAVASVTSRLAALETQVGEIERRSREALEQLNALNAAQEVARRDCDRRVEDVRRDADLRVGNVRDEADRRVSDAERRLADANARAETAEDRVRELLDREQASAGAPSGGRYVPAPAIPDEDAGKSYGGIVIRNGNNGVTLHYQIAWATGGSWGQWQTVAIEPGTALLHTCEEATAFRARVVPRSGRPWLFEPAATILDRKPEADDVRRYTLFYDRSGAYHLHADAR